MIYMTCYYEVSIKSHDKELWEVITTCTFGDDAQLIFDSYTGGERGVRVRFSGTMGDEMIDEYLPPQPKEQP